MRVKITLACTECKQRNYNMTKETVAVLAVSVLLGVIIAVVDLIVRFGIEFIVK